MSGTLPLVRALLGADAVFALCWVDDRTATIEAADPPVRGTLPIASVARDIACESGVHFEQQRVRRLVSSGVASLLPAPPAAALIVLAHAEDGKPPLGAFLAVWDKVPERAPVLRASPVRDAVTEFFHPREAEVATRRLATRLASVTSVIPQATVFIDDASGTALLNRAASVLLGVPEGDVPSGELAAAMTRLRSRAENRVEIEARASVLQRDGAARIDNWLWSFEEPVRRDLRVGTYPIGDSTLSGRLWVFDDVTAHRDAERLLEQRYNELESLYGELEAMNEALELARDEADAANAAKSAFLNQMSHELRTPLNAIIGFTNVLLRVQRTYATDTKSELYLSRIRENGTHLLALLNDILDLAKIEAGKLEVVNAPVDIAQLIRDTIAQLDTEGRRPGVALVADTPDRAVMVETDAIKLRQVVINLVGNALKFTERGSVTVRLRIAGDGAPLAIDVSDTGIGIAPERLSAVFEAFEQAERDTATKFGGTGLGLAISRRLVEALGFRLDVASVLGEGTTFTIALQRID